LLASAGHLCVRGWWWSGGVMELYEWGLVTNVAAVTALLIALPLAARYLHLGARRAGAFAALLALIVRDIALPEACTRVRTLLLRYPGYGETLGAMQRAEALAAEVTPLHAEALVALGEGWDADEALAIALACALAAPDFVTGVRLAVNHDGDSDSTGAIAGNLLGALHGVEAIPQRWLAGLEGARVLAEVADDLATFPDWPIGEFVAEGETSDHYRQRYPGS
jgi:hypothetical protein